MTPRETAAGDRAVLEERARRLARPLAVPSTGATVDVFHFALGRERYAIEVAFVRRVFSFGRVTAVPGLPAHLLGLVNADGHVVPLVDLGALLGGAPGPTATRAILLGREAADLALAVESTTGIEALPLAELTAAGPRQPPVRAVRADALVVLDGAALLADRRLVVGSAPIASTRSKEVER